MWQSRYPHAAAGRFASIPFALVGLLGGFFVSDLLPRSPAAPITALLFGVIGAGTAYVVFSTEAPARPGGYQQGAAADGVIAGIITGMTGTVLDVLAASGAGSTDGGASPSASQIVIALALAILVGGIGGGILGLAVGTAGGEARFLRKALPRKAKKARGRHPRHKHK